MAAYQTLQLMQREFGANEFLQSEETDLARIGVRIAFTDSLKEIEPTWRALEANGIDSPGQSYDFIRIWTETFDIPRQNQAFVGVEIAGRPLMVAAFERKRKCGLCLLVPFAGTHVGVNAPLFDRERMALLSTADLKAIWTCIGRTLGADIVRFGRVRADDAEFLPGATALRADCLFRTEFASWEDCDRLQRTRSRRKHDKQQGAKLAAMGEVTYEEIDAGSDSTPAIDALFTDRAARFAEQGISDPFAAPEIRAFYRSVYDAGDRLKGHMQVLRLDGRIVAARYNLIAGSRMFCLISSMSTDPDLQPGSPGKQILVHIMQHIFLRGIESFDMGAGFTDEKRHWCNVQIELFEMLMPATAKGRIFAFLLGIVPSLKQAIKRNPKLYAFFKSMRARLAG